MINIIKQEAYIAVKLQEEVVKSAIEALQQIIRPSQQSPAFKGLRNATPYLTVKKLYYTQTMDSTQYQSCQINLLQHLMSGFLFKETLLRHSYYLCCSKR